MINGNEIIKSEGSFVTFQPSSSSSVLKTRLLTQDKRNGSKSNISSTVMSGSDDGDGTEIIESKQVNFNECVKVILIPSRAEYVKRGLTKHLWWTQQDYFSFQQEARSEIQLYAIVQRISFLEARRKLYQPSTEGTDFFIAGHAEEEEDDFLFGCEELTEPLNASDGSRTATDEHTNAKITFYHSPSNSVACGLDEMSIPLDLKIPFSPAIAIKSSIVSSVTESSEMNETASDTSMDISIDTSMESLPVTPREIDIVETSISCGSAERKSPSGATTLVRSSGAQSITKIRQRSRGNSADLDDDLDVRLCVPLSQHARLHQPSDVYASSSDPLSSITPSITLYSAIALAAVVVASRFI